MGSLRWSAMISMQCSVEARTKGQREWLRKPGLFCPFLVIAMFACVSAVNAAPLIVPAGSIITGESCVTTNGAIDPGETVTIAFSLRNDGSSDTTNLVATLMATGGVTSPSGPQIYGSLAASGPATTQSFAFTADGACGSTITGTLQLQDGPNALGTVVFHFQLGRTILTFSENFDNLTSPNLPPGWSATNAAGTGVIWSTTATIRDSLPNSVFAPDPDTRSDLQLVSPAIAVSSEASQLTFRHSFSFESGYDGGRLEISLGGGAFTDVLTAGGSFANGGYNGSILFGSVPAWSGNSSGFMTTTVNLPASAAGQALKLRWRLTSDSSTAGVGWYVDTVSISEVQCCAGTNSADMSVALTGAPDTVLVDSNLTYTVRATNRGPATATGVMLTNLLPVGVTNLVSLAASQGTCTNQSGAIVCNLGSLTNNGAATVIITVKPGALGTITNLATVMAEQLDSNLLNNSAAIVTTVNLPALSINDISMTEGDTGTANAVFTVTLSPASGKTVTVAYATADGSATAPADYVSTNGLLTFNPGQTSKTIAVAVKGDSLSEANEVFSVNLLNATNAMLGSAQGQCTIVDNDPLPALSINNVTLLEGNTGTTNAIFTVTLSPVSGQDVFVDYQTTNGTGTAVIDYLAVNDTLFFSAGETNQTIVVPIVGETLNEANETFFVNLSNPIGATISGSQGVGAIINDDFLANIGAAGATLINESCSPANGAIDPNETVTVNIFLENAGTGTARTTNLIATLLAAGGVSSPSAAQNYGVLTVGGPAASRAFTFVANGVCGGAIAAALQLQDGPNNLGFVTNLLSLGKPQVVFTESFDGVTVPNLPAGWTVSLIGTGAVWTTTTTAKDTMPNSAFAPDPNGTGDNRLTSPPIAISTASAQLTFRHNYNAEEFLDGCVLEISIGGGPFTDILAAGGNFGSGGYNGTINGGAKPAWTGYSTDFITTKVSLPAFAAGQNVQLRWRFLSDFTVGDIGWYIDTISVTDGTTCCAGTNVLPVLAVGQSGSNIVISWAASFQGYRLVSATNLTPVIVWAPLTNAVIVINGQNTVSQTIQSGPVFFRLINP